MKSPASPRDTVRTGFYLLFFLIVVFVFCVCSVVADAHSDNRYGQSGFQLTEQQLLKIVELPRITLPYHLYRTLHDRSSNLPTSDSQGLVITSLPEDSRLTLFGFRESTIILSMNDHSIASRRDFALALANHVGDTITVTYEHLEDVNEARYSRQRTPISPANSKKSFSFYYQLPQQKVVVNPRSNDYHKLNMRHSPSTKSSTTYKSPERARAAGYKECPVCFSGGSRSFVQKLVQEEMGSIGPYVERLLNQYGQVEPTPDRYQALFSEIIQSRFRFRLVPRLIILDTNRLVGIGTADGIVAVSRGLMQYAGTKVQQKLILGHNLAHLDLQHPPQSRKQQKFISTMGNALEKAINIGVGINVGSLSGALFEISGQEQLKQRLSGLGYKEEHEHEAHLLASYYVSATESIPDIRTALKRWGNKRRDLIEHPHSNWTGFLVMHPELDVELDHDTWFQTIKKFRTAPNNMERVEIDRP